MATGKLTEVEQDAMRITAKRFRDDQEMALEKEMEVKEKTPEQILAEVQRTAPHPEVDKTKEELVDPKKVKEANASAKQAEKEDPKSPEPLKGDK